MTTTKELHRTEITPGSPILDIGIDVVTSSEKFSDVYFVFYVFEMAWNGFVVVSQKTYLQGKYEGFEQTINIELPDEAMVDAVSSEFHSIGVAYAHEIKDILKEATFLKLAESMVQWQK